MEKFVLVVQDQLPVEEEQIWWWCLYFISFCHPSGPCGFPSCVCPSAKQLVLKQEALPPCAGCSPPGPSGRKAAMPDLHWCCCSVSCDGDKDPKQDYHKAVRN